MFNFAPSPQMMNRMGLNMPGSAEQQGMGMVPSNGMPGGDGGGFGGLMSILQNPSFMDKMRGGGQMPPPGGGGDMPMGGPIMRKPMPVGGPMQLPGNESGGGAPRMDGPKGPKQPGMMNKFASMSASMAPMFGNMIMDDERKKQGMLWR